MRSAFVRRVAVLTSVLLLAMAAVARPVRGDVTREQVERAIHDAISHLRRSQGVDGGWNGPPGLSELAVLALLTAGERPDDPRMAAALEAVRLHAPNGGFGTYAVALQTMALSAADPVRYRREIARNALWLEAAMVRSFGRGGPRSAAGAWTYNMQGGGGDNSNTQYAVLGLNAAREAGVPIAEEVLAAARRHWEECQQNDGGWGYQFGPMQSSASMTCAGVSSLILTGRRVYRGFESLQGERISRCGQGENDVALLRGLAWLGKNFRVDMNFGGQNQWTLYYLYGLERAGRLSGQRFFGNHDWYREGAEQLVKTQDRLSGAWPNGGSGPTATTSFALLFLAKGRAPVLALKLRHGPRGDWDNDRDDLGNLTALVSRDWNHLLTWQVVDSEQAEVADLLQAPILFFNGHRDPEFSDLARKRLRDFVDQGGFIFADACCGSPDFDRGFRELMRGVFPEEQYKLHPLREDHAVWRSRHLLTPDIHPLWGIDYGCRTVVIYSPGDLSCFWNQMDSAPGNPAVVRASRVGQNVIDYATGRELPADKLAPREVVRDRLEPPKRGALQIAKLKHAGDWNVAPMAVPHLTSALRDRAGLDVVIDHREILPDDPNLANFPLLYIHGRSSLTLSADDQKALRRHLDPGGGTIFADAACGSTSFDTSFRKLLGEMLPDHKLVPIPRDDPIYTRQVGYDLSQVKYTKGAGSRQGYPELEGILINGHWAVIYSRYDIGCALERLQALECPGYTHDSAMWIAANIVLYSTLP
jgi:hypothetical protein